MYSRIYSDCRFPDCPVNCCAEGEGSELKPRPEKKMKPAFSRCNQCMEVYQIGSDAEHKTWCTQFKPMRKASTVMIFHPDGRIWECNTVPVGKEKEVGLRLMGMKLMPGIDHCKVPYGGDAPPEPWLKVPFPAEINCVIFKSENQWVVPNEQFQKASEESKKAVRGLVDMFTEAYEKDLMDALRGDEEEEPEGPDGITDYDCTIK